MINLAEIPEELKEGESWELLDLDENWIWLERDEDGRVVGILLAGNCHGLVFIWRVKVVKAAPPWTLGKLFRHFIRDLRKRNCLGYLALLDIVNRTNEAALARIAFRAGAHFTTATTIIYGSVNAKHVGEL